MGQDQVKEGVSLLAEYTSYHDEDPLAHQQLTPPSKFDLEDEVIPATRKETTLGALKYLGGQLLALFVSFLRALIPSFIPRWGSSAQEAPEDRRLSPTAYLDGLRGVAAFIVYLTHFVVNWFPAMRNTYGASESDHYLVQLPIIRNFFSGMPAVTTFFIVSGYALSYNALKKVHQGEKATVLDALSSSAFRRCFRLYLPCMADSFFCMILAYNGWFTPDPEHWNTIPPTFATFSGQFWDWWNNQLVLMYPFLPVEGEPYSPPYNGHMWTIPLEIRGSFVVYGTVLAGAKLSSFWRMAFFVAWDAYLFYMGKWDLFLFVSGVVLANFDVPRRMRASKMESNGAIDGELFLPRDEPHMTQMSMEDPVATDLWSRVKNYKRRNATKIQRIYGPILAVLRNMSPYALFVLGLYLQSFPHFTFGAWILPYLTPDRWDWMPSWFGKKVQTWRCVGSVIVAASLSLSPPTSRIHPERFVEGAISKIRGFHLQALFTNSFVQYLGRISFGLYLMHGPVLFCIGTKIMVPAYNQFNEDHDNSKYVKAFLWAAVVNTPTVFFAADIFTRCIDERSVRWAAKIAKFMSRNAQGAVGK